MWPAKLPQGTLDLQRLPLGRRPHLIFLPTADSFRSLQDRQADAVAAAVRQLVRRIRQIIPPTHVGGYVGVLMGSRRYLPCGAEAGGYPRRGRPILHEAGRLGNLRCGRDAPRNQLECALAQTCCKIVLAHEWACRVKSPPVRRHIASGKHGQH